MKITNKQNTYIINSVMYSSTYVIVRIDGNQSDLRTTTVKTITMCYNW